MRSGIRRVLRITARNDASIRGEVHEERELHVQLRTEQLMSDGMNAQQARREAECMFAASDETLTDLHRTARERSRHMWLQDGWDGWRQDIRYATRGLLRDPLTSCFIVAALTLGIGANVTAVTLLDRILLRGPAHVSAPEQLVRVYGTRAELTGDVTSSWMPHGSYEQLREGVRSLERVGAYRVTQQAVGRGADARTMRVAETLGDYFGTLGTTAIRGRLHSPTQDDAAAGRLAVVSEAYWRAQLGSADDVLGASLPVGEETYTIVGVAPVGFTGAELRRVDVWVQGDERSARTRNWNVIGRMAPNATPDVVQQDVAQVHARPSETVPRWFREARFSVGPVRYDDTGREPFEATMARWLTGVSLVILIVAFGNVVNLLLARSARRRRELAVRAALGCGRGRLLRLVALEGALLASVAGLLSLLVVRALEPAISTVLLAGDAPWVVSLLDARLLLVLVATVLFSVLVIGLAPALQAGSARLTGFLREGDHGGVRGSRTRAALTVLQAAMSVVLLVGAGLFVRSLDRVRALDLGVDRDEVLVVRARLIHTADAAAAGTAEHELNVLGAAADAVAALPGVSAAAVAVGLPLDGGSFSASLFITGRDSVPSSSSGPFASAVGPGYFEAIGTAVLRGRGFDDGDVAGAAPVVIINETMAHTLWPAADAIDQCIGIGDALAPCARVIGVVQDVHRVGLKEAPSLQFYLPLSQQQMFGGAVLLVRPTSRAPIAGDALRRSIIAADPSIRTVDIAPLGAALDGEMRPLRLGMLAFGLSGVLAFVIAVLGLYSVMAYMVAWRTREIGVRLALGATSTQIIRMIIVGGGRLAAIGVACALVVVLAGRRWIEPHLFETSATDPLVLGGVTAAILAVAAVAGWIPAARAVRVNATEALR